MKICEVTLLVLWLIQLSLARYCSKPCIHGMCIPFYNFPVCICLSGYTGQYCEKDTDNCIGHQCQNNATCHDQVGWYRCLCPAGFTGRLCELDIQAPSISCPFNITKRPPPRIKTASINFEPVEMSDNTNVKPRLNSTFPSGYDFPIGLYVIELTAIDEAGNVGRCFFEIRLLRDIILAPFKTFSLTSLVTTNNSRDCSETSPVFHTPSGFGFVISLQTYSFAFGSQVDVLDANSGKLIASFNNSRHLGIIQYQTGPILIRYGNVCRLKKNHFTTAIKAESLTVTMGTNSSRNMSSLDFVYLRPALHHLTIFETFDRQTFVLTINKFNEDTCGLTIGDGDNVGDIESIFFKNEDFSLIHSDSSSAWVHFVNTNPSSTDCTYDVSIKTKEAPIESRFQEKIVLGPVLRKKIINSPNFPGVYTDYTDYTWLISIPETPTHRYATYIRFRSMNIQKMVDVLIIGAGDSQFDRSSIISSIRMDNENLKTIRVEELHIWIRYQTGLAQHYNGVSILLQTIPVDREKCNKNKIKCNSQRCIPQQWKCDGIYDCPDGTDEAECGLEYNLRGGKSIILTSPNHPMKYPRNSKIIWIFRTIEGFRILVKFLQFQLEQDSDYVELGEGLDPELLRIDRFSGRVIPDEIISISNGLWFTFYTDNSFEYRGFVADIASIERSKSIGEVFLKRKDMIYLQSPNYPSNYSSGEDIIWLLSTNQKRTIKVVFLDFDLEPRQFDSLSIGEGSDPARHEKLKVSGWRLPPEYISITNSIWVRFLSDTSVTYKGFNSIASSFNRPAGTLLTELTIPCDSEKYICKDGSCISPDSVCDFILDCPQGEEEENDCYLFDAVNISSPNYPRKYNGNEQVTWVFRVAAGLRILVQFFDFQMERNNEYIDIGDGTDPTVPQVIRITQDDDFQDEVISKSNSLWMTFDSDGHNHFRGFTSYVSAVHRNASQENIILEAFGNFILRSPRYPYDYSSGSDITWFISAPENFSLQVKFLQFDLEAGYDFLIIGEGFDADEGKIEGFSGNRIPIVTYITNSFGWLRFTSDNYNNFKGFLVEICALPSEKVELQLDMTSSGSTCTSGQEFCDDWSSINSISESDSFLCEDGSMGSNCNDGFTENADNIIHLPINATLKLTSPRYPEAYPTEMESFWNYHVAPSPYSVTLVDFIFFDTEEHWDFVSIGKSICCNNKNLLHTFSGSITPDVVCVDEVQFWIRFNSDLSVTHLGFEVELHNILASNCSVV